MDELMFKNTKVSIIMVTLNAGLVLTKAIRSVAEQSYPNREYIIIDGASTDDTVKIIKEHPSVVSKWISEPDGGIYEAFNKGIGLASGDVVYFLNADDYLTDPAVLHDVASVFSRNSDLQIVYGNTLAVDETADYRYTRGKSFTLEDLKTGDMPPHPGFFVKSELIERIGLFDTHYKIAADFDFIIRCFKAAADQSCYFNRTIAVFSEGGVSTNPEKQQLMNREQQQIIKEHFGCDQAPNLQLTEINGLYKVWLESLLLHEKGITHCLHNSQVKNVVIFGTRKTALYLYEDLKQATFNILCFLDNNPNMQQQTLKGLPIYPEEWLEFNYKQLDAVILSIEGQHDAAIKARLEKMIDNHDVLILSWKDLARMGRSR
jgi:glycosyltransferase involved in cell wall biosynthesis